ncbi:MAG: type II secretion system F family protein [Candidatus Paceibacterota bacterium]|jgi:type IV pilus assembly protein PilC
MKFKYQARTKEGLVQVGTIEASSRQRAVAILQEQGIYITSLFLEEKKPFYTKELAFFGGSKRKELVNFTRQLSLMVKSGVSLVEGLRSIAMQTDKEIFREIVLKVADEVEGGIYFSDALSKFPRIFSSFYINMIKSGEASGKLSESLKYLADNLEKEYKLILKIKGGMTYPAVIFIAFLLIGLAMLFFVLPNFSQSVKDLNVQLPKITSSILNLGQTLKDWWWLGMIVIIFLVVGTWRYLKTSEGKVVWDRVSLNIPVIGNIVKKINLVRFSENLSTLIYAGLPITQALEVVAGVITNKVYKDIVLHTRDGVRRGEPISSVLEQYPKSVPSVVAQMAKVGEKTGRLDESLLKISEFYQMEINNSIDGLVSIIEPILILVLGGLIVILMLSVFLPIYKNIGSFAI